MCRLLLKKINTQKGNNSASILEVKKNGIEIFTSEKSVEATNKFL